jgi:hypothetical protein
MRPESSSGPASRQGASVAASEGQRWKPGSALPKTPLLMTLSEPVGATGWSHPAVSSSAMSSLRCESTSAERREVASRTRTSELKSRT